MMGWRRHTMLTLTAWLIVAGAGCVFARAQYASMGSGEASTSAATQNAGTQANTSAKASKWTAGTGAFKAGAGAQRSTWGATQESVESSDDVKWGTPKGSMGAEPGGIWRDSNASPESPGAQGPGIGIGSTSTTGNSYVTGNAARLNTTHSFLPEPKQVSRSVSNRNARSTVRNPVGSSGASRGTAAHHAPVKRSFSNRSAAQTAGVGRGMTSVNRTLLQGMAQSGSGSGPGTQSGRAGSGLLTPSH